jgi:hypothetical protein
MNDIANPSVRLKVVFPSLIFSFPLVYLMDDGIFQGNDDLDTQYSIIPLFPL